MNAPIIPKPLWSSHGHLAHRHCEMKTSRQSSKLMAFAPKIFLLLLLLHMATPTIAGRYLKNEVASVNEKITSSPSDLQPLSAILSPSFNPTKLPSSQPSFAPLTPPSNAPTGSPTISRVSPPTFSPTISISTDVPSMSPTTNPSMLPSEHPSNSPTIEPSFLPSHTPSKSPSNVPSQQPTEMPTDLPTQIPTDSPSLLPTGVPTTSPTSVPSQQHSNDPTKMPTDSPSLAPTDIPTNSLSLLPSNVPTSIPSSVPSHIPSNEPTQLPTDVATLAPTNDPTDIPSKTLTDVPSSVPSMLPTQLPSTVPSIAPSDVPSDKPSRFPSDVPSDEPSMLPTNLPSIAHSDVPTGKPSMLPSDVPSDEPTMMPTHLPTNVPSMLPSKVPTGLPTIAIRTISPTSLPSLQPSKLPTNEPTTVRTTSPSSDPTVKPSAVPTNVPSTLPSLPPSEKPSSAPSSAPTLPPSDTPSAIPSSAPSTSPSKPPSVSPSLAHTSSPTFIPSISPTHSPTSSPSSKPTSSVESSSAPSINPTNTPSSAPSINPTNTPSSAPSINPTSAPSSEPSSPPSFAPSMHPSDVPTSSPSTSPSLSPTTSPAPTHEPSSSPTFHPTTASPSLSPTTESPSANPTPTPPVEVTANVILQMNNVPGSIMSFDTKTLLENAMNDWLQGLFDLTVPKIENVRTTVQTQRLVDVRLRRRLQDDTQYQPLMLDIEAIGEFQPSEAAKTATDANFQTKLVNFYRTPVNNAVLLDNLKAMSISDTGYEYFLQVTDIIVETDPNEGQSSNPNVSNPSGDNKTAAIVAGTVCGVAFLLFVVALYGFISKKKRLGRSYGNVEADADRMMLAGKEDVSPRHGRNERQEPARNIPEPDNSFSVDEEDDATDAGRSQRTFQTLEKLYSQDNMSYQSYGYSLDDGLESKQSYLISPSTPGDRNAVPTEVDQFGHNFDPDEVDASVGSPSTTYSGLTDVGPGSSVGATSMLKDTYKSSKDYESVTRKPIKSIVTDAERKNTASSGNKPVSSGRYRRDCFAPPGKLGVVIDTTRNGPVVHEVKAGSPLEHVIFPGDRIIAIDDTDTRSMSASAVTKMMARKMDLRRKITVSSTMEVFE